MSDYLKVLGLYLFSWCLSDPYNLIRYSLSCSPEPTSYPRLYRRGCKYFPIRSHAVFSAAFTAPQMQKAMDMVNQFVFFFPWLYCIFPKSVLISGPKGVSMLIFGVLCEFQALFMLLECILRVFCILCANLSEAESTFVLMHTFPAALITSTSKWLDGTT